MAARERQRLDRGWDDAGDWWGLGAFLLLLALLAVAELIIPARQVAREDARRLPTNFGFGLINGGLAAMLPLSAVIAAEWARGEGIGLFNLVAVPAPITITATVLLRSLLAYLLHRLFHASPWLWRIHRVHHCDTALDLSTGFRSHPLELMLIAAGASAAAILLGLSPEALLAYELAAIALVLATHANWRLPERVDRPLRWLLVTPAMHHVHHSAHQPETDSNYGEVFSVWDRLLGTYSRPEQRATIRLGLGERYDPEAAKLAAQLLLPLRDPSAGPLKSR
jgi:sterol desaturase/sphingolipid hydroxylase (fatty acid hydroxylase superfamily)